MSSLVMSEMKFISLAVINKRAMKISMAIEA
jgi:hypothetical protein